jgi:pimeloyl-ACP methyl ester carboxylesterase
LPPAESKNNPVDLHHSAPTQFIEVYEINYAYRVFGNKTGIPIILLQHFTGTIDNWDPVITNGLADHFQVVLFDNKGIGASGGETPGTIQAMAKDAISFIRALQFEKVNLLGFSMGGFIAQQITLDEPVLVNKIILVGTGPKSAYGLADIVRPLTASASMDADEQKLFLFYGPKETSRALGEQSLSRINSRTIDRVPNTTTPAIQTQLKAMLDWAQPDEDALEKLNQISQPVFIVNGHNDIMIPTINSYTLFHNLANARLSLYPDSGHGSMYQYPGLFLSEVVPFLKSDINGTFGNNDE